MVEAEEIRKQKCMSKEWDRFGGIGITKEAWFAPQWVL